MYDDDEDMDHVAMVASLPGSSRGDNNYVGVTNYVLMPQSGKMPGFNPPIKSKAVPAHLLGSGSKIPASHDTRMRSQFSSPDPAIYTRKKRKKSAKSKSVPDAWWTDRPASTPCAVYRTGTKDAKAGDAKEGDVISTKRAKQIEAEKAAAVAEKQKADQKAKETRLRGQKEMILSHACQTFKAGSSSVYKAMAQVGAINKELGLPYNDFGSWVMPREV